MNMNERTGDLVLPQGTYVLLQDGATGQVEVVTGPHKVSLADTDKPVIYDPNDRTFVQVTSKEAIKICPAADEGQYILLLNPSADNNGEVHPAKGKQNSIDLNIGRKINIQGPKMFSLYPGQYAEVIDGHQLKSNEYLLIRIYNEEAAKNNLKNAVVKKADNEKDEKSNKNLLNEKDIKTGNLHIIKGTDVSFYIPPTGIEVLSEKNNNYIRRAITLERLEYCILLDQNGDKRYVKGPDVVFPKPTETFIEQNNMRVFKAIELNENMGIYIKVIANYKEEDNKREYKAGEELFITGKEQKIYFPRAEHAIIKYGDNAIHYSTAVPAGEARYVLDKIEGDVKLAKGPKMLLPNPVKEVIVKRILDIKTVNLWFPGNSEAIEYNKRLKSELEESDSNFLEESSMFERGTRVKAVLASFSAVADEMVRKTNYTKPRTIKLDTKYDGAIVMNIWPNYAVQIVNKTGHRKVVEGPSMIMLEYDETLDVLELSTGTPKSDEHLIKTVYLQTKNNVISDVVEVETKDLVNASITLSYRVNFDGENKKWFNVSNYVKLLTQHLRSIIRNAIKKTTIEELNENTADLVRNCILGESKEGKRTGRKFDENGMNVYDIEVLALSIGDSQIASLLRNNQHQTVKQNLEIVQAKKEVENLKTLESLKRQKIEELTLTEKKQIEHEQVIFDKRNEVDLFKLNKNKEKQPLFDSILDSELERSKKENDQKIEINKEESNIRMEELNNAMDSIQPKLIEAVISSNNLRFTETLAKNLKQENGLINIFSGNGGIKALKEVVKGTPIEKTIENLSNQYDELYKDNK